jgi:hypothetical protein
MYDPITQRDFYAMKALFDPLVLRKLVLATPAEIFAHARALDEAESEQAALQEPIDRLIAPYKQKLYDDRVALLPADVQAIIRKPENARTPLEQKIADDYFPVLRIDLGKIREIMPEAERKTHQELQRRLDQAQGRSRVAPLPAFWTVEVDPKKELQKSYVLTSGDPDRPEIDHEVTPGWPFAPAEIDFREGRIEAFSDWLTAPENPLFARVAVNRLWQWHFGAGLVPTPSDFGNLGGTPSLPELLDWLASEFVRRNFSMKQMHRLIVTSETYRLASIADPEIVTVNTAADPDNTSLWRFGLRRLDAESSWDAIWTAAGTLDLAVGGPSFDLGAAPRRRGGGTRAAPRADMESPNTRRAAYMIRGYSTSREVMPDFLKAFDVDDGRAPCPVRTRTVTAPQSLFLMNSDTVDRAAAQLADRLKNESAGSFSAAVDLGYRITLGRPPTPAEQSSALSYLENDPARFKGLAWLLLNLDEFLYVR